MPDRLICDSWLVYATRSPSTNARRIKSLILDIKEDRLDASSRRPKSALTIERAMQRAPDQCRRAFEGDPLLVPVPGSGLTKPNTIWSSQRLAEELVKQGLGADVVDIVHRIHPVDKSAGSRRRPTLAEQRASLLVRPRLKPPTALLLIDDVVTTGTTLMSCARCLIEAYPQIPIGTFALARVQSEGDPETVFLPAREFITVSGERCRRGQ